VLLQVASAEGTKKRKNLQVRRNPVQAGRTAFGQTGTLVV